MNLFKFELNTIVFLILVIVTIVLWVGFEFYHRTGSGEIESSLKVHAETPLEDSFDATTLERMYNNQSNFYETTTTPTR